MTRINIPFHPMFEKPLRNGTKTMTARTKRKGDVGDTFVAFGRTFILTEVRKVQLHVVRGYYMHEGCDSPEHFEAVWKRIHPRRGYRPDDWVWLHEFDWAGG